MKIKIISIFVLISIFSLSIKCLKHECVHDKLKKHPIQNEVIESGNGGRRLTNIGSPIRITMNLTNLTSQSNNTLTNFISDALTIAIQAIQEYVYVFPETSSLTIPETCVEVASGSQTGISSSDLHLYISAANSSGQSFVAWAANCQLRNYRPIVGQVNFNTYFIQTYGTQSSFFYDLVRVTIHELTHVLGFDGDLIKNFRDPNTLQVYSNPDNVGVVQNIRGINTYVLKTPNVLQVTKEHFCCSSVIGAQLENGGGSGSKGSHWEKSILYNELMNSVDFAKAQLTKFTLAFLADSNWYSFINMTAGDTTYWGKCQGCDFLYKTCTNDSKPQQFSEYTIHNSTTQQCDFFSSAVGLITNESTSSSVFIENSCNYVQAYSDYGCSRLTTSPLFNTDSLESFSSSPNNSKCFNSTLMPSTSLLNSSLNFAKCYQYMCNDSGIIITLGSNTVLCTYSGQQISNLAGFTGFMQCPQNLTQFCQIANDCPNFCSKNGYCFQGSCRCYGGFAGSDCSVASCTTAVSSSASTCVLNCQSNEYKEQYSKQCYVCNKACLTCQGDGYKNCLSCNTGYTLQSGTNVCLCNGNQVTLPYGSCASSCLQGYYITNQQCLTCNKACLSCTGGLVSQCQSCSLGYSLTNSNTCQCNGSNVVTNDDGTCVSCSTTCSSCSSSLISTCQTKCNMCNSNIIKTSNQYLLKGMTGMTLFSVLFFYFII